MPSTLELTPIMGFIIVLRLFANLQLTHRKSTGNDSLRPQRALVLTESKGSDKSRAIGIPFHTLLQCQTQRDRDLDIQMAVW